MTSLWLYLFAFVPYTESAKILGLFPFPSISHQVTFQPIWKELSLRGHDVTVMTTNILNETALTNLTEIDVGFAYELMWKYEFAKVILNDNNVLEFILFSHELMMKIIEAEINYEEVQKLIHKNETEFDVILLEGFHPLIYAFGARFKAPIITMSSMDVVIQTHDSVGNPTHPVISPDIWLNLEGDLSFLDRVRSFLYNIWYRMLHYWYILPQADKIARKYFGEDMPYLGDIEKNISMVMINVNPIIHTIRANVPNVIEYGQLHIKGRKPLPKDLENYLDSSPQGLIYFSLGSNVKSTNLPLEKINMIIQALSELPYNVLWKWEDDYLPNQPKNVLVRKWLPQQDVLAHPHVKAFVTQGGIQSLQEAVSYEVPMIGIPFITDQYSNIKKLADLGMAVGLNFKLMTKDQLKDAILEVAQNIRYKEQVQRYKAIIADQPLDGLDKAIWWIEYAIRHKGAKHLRSPAADMPFYKYFMLDVIGFLLILNITLIYLVFKIFILLRAKTKADDTKLKVN